MELARLDGGALRYTGARCGFVVSRVAPGSLHVAIQGDDRGEIGGEVFAELERENARFGLPLTLWVDARRASAPSDAVRDAWAEWFARRRSQLERVRMLVPDAVLALTGHVVRQLSGTLSILQVSSDVPAFAASLDALEPGLSARLELDRSRDAPVHVQRTETAGVVRLSDGDCAYEYRRPSAAVLRLDIQGRDSGRLGALPLDELMHQQRGQQKAGVLFVDAGAAGSVDARVRDEWVAWIRAHRDDFATMSILAGSRLMQLTFGLAREAAQAGQRMRIYDDRGAFDADLARQLGR